MDTDWSNIRAKFAAGQYVPVEHSRRKADVTNTSFGLPNKGKISQGYEYDLGKLLYPALEGKPNAFKPGVEGVYDALKAARDVSKPFVVFITWRQWNVAQFHDIQYNED